MASLDTTFPRWINGTYVLAPAVEPTDPELNGTRAVIPFVVRLDGEEVPEGGLSLCPSPMPDFFS